jgi:hypothetical protein
MYNHPCLIQLLETSNCPFHKAYTHINITSDKHLRRPYSMKIADSNDR